MEFEQTESHKQFDGFTNTYTHFSEVCQSKMNFSAFIPPQASHKKLPVLYWLSGLTCSEQILLPKHKRRRTLKNMKSSW
jgi:S-formylglutathione hydrolase